MATDVVMPQMGESIFEGTITKWLKKLGDKVQRDEPLFEISTDKVDAEIPAPAAGVLKEIKVKEGDTVQVNTVVAVIDAEGSTASVTSAAGVKPPSDGDPGVKQQPAQPAPPPAAPPRQLLLRPPGASLCRGHPRSPCRPAPHQRPRLGNGCARALRPRA